MITIFISVSNVLCIFISLYILLFIHIVSTQYCSIDLLLFLRQCVESPYLHCTFSTVNSSNILSLLRNFFEYIGLFVGSEPIFSDHIFISPPMIIFGCVSSMNVHICFSSIFSCSCTLFVALED